MTLKDGRKYAKEIKLAKIDEFMDEIDLSQPVIDSSKEIEQHYNLGKSLKNFFGILTVDEQYLEHTVPTASCFIFRTSKFEAQTV